MKSFGIIFLFIFICFPALSQQNWSIDPTLYQFSMSATIELYKGEEALNGNGHKLSAWVNGELRGVAEIEQTSDKSLFYITVYANVASGEQVELKAYLSDADKVVPVSQGLTFENNAILGTPSDPEKRVIAEDYDMRPVLRDIPSQQIEVGEHFNTIPLNDFLTNQDNDSISWSLRTDDTELKYRVEQDTLYINLPYGGWIGQDTLRVVATEQTSAQLSDSTMVLFSVREYDAPPEISGVPNQTIGLSDEFKPVDLTNYAFSFDKDELTYATNITAPGTVVSKVPAKEFDPSLFQYSMNFTFEVALNGNLQKAENDLIEAFIDGKQRGLSKVELTEGRYLHYLTVYSNTLNSKISLKLFKGAVAQSYPIVQTFAFQANTSIGNPNSPFKLNAGPVKVTFDEGVATIKIVDAAWFGTFDIDWIAQDANTDKKKKATTTASYTILNDHTPSFKNIQDQVVELPEQFQAFNLNDYVNEQDGDSLKFDVLNQGELAVTVSENGMVGISAPTSSWVGKEIVEFRVQDITDQSLHSEASVVLQATGKDVAPKWKAISEQLTGKGSDFTPLNLNDWLTEQNGNDIAFSYEIVSTSNASAPAWNVKAEDYQFSMNLTAVVSIMGEKQQGREHMLAAFSGDEIRGKTKGVLIDNNWYYFLTVYANTNGDTISFKFYDANNKVTFDLREELSFGSNQVVGTPSAPYVFNYGAVRFSLKDSILAADVVDDSYAGTHSLMLIAKDLTPIGYSDTVWVDFTVAEDYQPAFADTLKGQTIVQGEVFKTIDLAEYVAKQNGGSVYFEVAESEVYQVSLEGNVLYVEVKDAAFIGGGEIAVKVINATTGLYDEARLVYTVTRKDRSPVLSSVPTQYLYTTTKEIYTPLSRYLMEYDGDSVSFRFRVAPTNLDSKPNWFINYGKEGSKQSVVARVISFGKKSDEGILAAFVNDEVRGLAQAVKVGSEKLFVFDVYATSNEEVSFKFYDSSIREVLPVTDTLNWTAQVYGTTNEPLILKAGYKMFAMHTDTLQTQPLITEQQREVWVIAQDINTDIQLADSVLVSFKLIQEAPKLLPFKDIVLKEGEQPEAIDLSAHLEYELPDSVDWEISIADTIGWQLEGKGNLNLFIKDPDYFGEEMVTVNVFDRHNPELSASQTFRIIIQPVNDTPSKPKLIAPSGILDGFQEVVKFKWKSSTDVDKDSLSYSLHISGAGRDTTITASSHTGHMMASQNAFEVNQRYVWFVQVSDGIEKMSSDSLWFEMEEKVAAPDTSLTLADIPGQGIVAGENFEKINLNSLVTYYKPNQLFWEAKSNGYIKVAIKDGVADLSLMDAEWVGTDTITFTVYDSIYTNRKATRQAVLKVTNEAPTLFELISPLGGEVYHPEAPLVFSWHPADDKDGHTVTYNLVILNAQDTVYVSEDLTDTTHTAEVRLPVHDNYQWYVTATDGYSYTESKIVGLFEIGQVTSLRNNEISEKLFFYPNPFNDRTSLNANNVEILEVQVFDLRGTLVFSKFFNLNVHEVVLRAEDLPYANLYIVKLKVKDKSEVKVTYKKILRL